MRQAEALASKLGGLTPAQAEAAKVTVVVVGMDYVLPDEVQDLRSRCAAAVQAHEAAINALKADIACREDTIARTKDRDAEVATLAATFGA